MEFWSSSIRALSARLSLTCRTQRVRTSLLSGVPQPPIELVVTSGSTTPSSVRRRSTRLCRFEDLAQQHRSSCEHSALIARLREEEDVSDSHGDPPANSVDWPESLLRSWFQEGGLLTMAALNSAAVSETPRRLIDEVGAGLPVQDLPDALSEGEDVLAGLRRGDDTVMSKLATSLESRDCAVCTLGLDGNFVVESLAAEIERARPYMQCGELHGADGSRVSGVSPSGSQRGDRFFLARNLPGGIEAWPHLAAVDEVLAAVTGTLSAQLKLPPTSIHVVRRSDLFVARFAGDGLGYGAHLDGDDKSLVTCILYISHDWKAPHGGRLLMLDEKRRCWWAVAPRLGTLVLFRSDRVLHKVEACYAPRQALTVFLSSGRSQADIEHERALVACMASSYL